METIFLTTSSNEGWGYFIRLCSKVALHFVVHTIHLMVYHTNTLYPNKCILKYTERTCQRGIKCSPLVDNFKNSNLFTKRNVQTLMKRNGRIEYICTYARSNQIDFTSPLIYNFLSCSKIVTLMLSNPSW